MLIYFVFGYSPAITELYRHILVDIPMKAERYIPVEALRPFIKSFMIVETEEGMNNNLLPDTSMTIVFRNRGSVMYSNNVEKKDLPPVVISGLRKSAAQVKYSPQTSNLLVLLHEGGAAAFLRQPLHELFNTTTGLDNFIRQSELAGVEEQLAATTTNLHRIAVVEQFFLSRLMHNKPDAIVTSAIQTIKQANGNISIKKLAAGLYISQDPLEKRFRKITGCSPKHFAKIVRFKKLVDSYSPHQSFTELAYDAGFFDQSHFIKEFKLFTGQAPQEFFRNVPRW